MRFIANRSSGKQGTAIAVEAAARGAIVTLVTTARLSVPSWVEVVSVDTAFEMQGAVVPRAEQADVVIMSAAVADQRPVSPSGSKTKKHQADATLSLEPTHDFLVDLGKTKPTTQVLVGFAAETNAVAENAAEKLRRKHLDLIVANDVSGESSGFDHDTNAVTILGADGSTESVALASKRRIAAAVLDAVTTCLDRLPAKAGTRKDLLRIMTKRTLFTSESVTEGHPDKMADQVSDAILDAILEQDPYGRVACETLLTTGLVVVAGEITTEAYVDIPRIARQTICDIGYNRESYGFDGNTCGVITSIDEQSVDIAQGVDDALEHRLGTPRPLGDRRRWGSRPSRGGRPGNDVRVRLRRDARPHAAAHLAGPSHG